MGGHFRTHRGRGDVAQGREENGNRIKGAVTGGLQPWAAGAQAPWGFCRRIAESSPCKDKAAGALARQLLSVLGTDSQPVQPAAPLGAEAGSQLTSPAGAPSRQPRRGRPLLHTRPPRSGPRISGHLRRTFLGMRVIPRVDPSSGSAPCPPHPPPGMSGRGPVKNCQAFPWAGRGVTATATVKERCSVFCP